MKVASWSTTIEPFEVDLSIFLPCETCRAAEGIPCRMLKTGRVKRTAHACRRVWIGGAA